MTCGGPPPLFSATAPIEKPTTGPPGVAAPAITAVSTPSQPESGPSQPGMISVGLRAGGDDFLRDDGGDIARADYPERDARHDVDEIHRAFAQRSGQHHTP